MADCFYWYDGVKYESKESLIKELSKRLKDGKLEVPKTGGLSSLRDHNGIKYLTDNPNLQGPIWKDGKLQHAQVFLPHNILKNIPGSENMSGAELKEILGDNLNEIIGYRIPNQGLSSIDALEIVGILPSSYGDMIMTYTEVTGKTGSDFDVDKMFVMMPNLKYNNKTNKAEKIKYIDGASENNILDRYYERYKSKVLKDNYDSIITELDTENEDVRNMISKGKKLRTEVLNAYGKDSLEFEAVQDQLSELYSSFIGFKELVLEYLRKDKTIPTVEEFSKLSVYEQNNNKALQNHLLHLYTNILSSEDTYEEYISPLDSEFLKEDAYIVSFLADIHNSEFIKQFQVKETITEEEWIVKTQKGKQVSIKYDKYDKPFKAVLNDIFDAGGSVERNSKGEIINVIKYQSLEFITNTGKKVTAYPYEVSGLKLPTESDLTITKYDPKIDIIQEFKKLPRKDQVKLAEKHFNSTTNLQFYTPTFQLKTKVRNTAGKAGTGQSSNHLVHHVLAQLSGLKINQNIGLGDQTDLSKVYSSDNRKINQTISAYLNAYVDNAKDPFISLINNNTFTANTAFYMLRSGISPEIVNRFISQPILKDLSKAHFNEKSKVKNKNIIFTSNINVELEGLTVIESNRVPSAVSTTINKYTNTKLFDRDEMKTLAGIVASSKLNVSDLNESMLEDLLIEPDKNSNEYIQKQLEILGLFLKVQKGASVLNDVMKATKADTKGAYGTFVEGIAIEELQKEIRESGNVENFDKLFTNTSIGAYDKFGLKMSKQVFDSKMINRTPGFKSILRSVYYAVGKEGEYLTDEEFNNKIAKEYYRYVSSGIDLFKIDKSDREYLFTELPKKLEALKDKYKDNLFIKTLSVKQVPGKYNFIAIQSSQISGTDNNNLLTKSWQKALDSEDTELSELAEDLVKYAYYGSGFRKNINSFYELIPSDWLNNIKENNYKTFYEDLLRDLQKEVIDNNFINQLIRHNPNDKDLVTTVKKVKAVNGGIIIDSENIPSNLISNNELTPYKKYVRTTQKVPDTDEIITSIYEYQLTDESGNVYYQSLQKLGYSEKSNVIVEYNYLGEVESFIYKNPIKMDLPKEFIHKPTIKFDFIEEVISEDKFTYKDLLVDGKQVIFTIEETPNGFATYVVNKVGNKKEVGLPISEVGSYTTKEATRFAATRYLNEVGYESLMNTLKSDNC